MNAPLRTRRLQLVPLSLPQLQMLLQDPEAFEASLKITLLREQLTQDARRALRRKTEKMQKADPSCHAWLTYWLIVVQSDNAGAGLLGFKGFPDENGSTEIGYGLDPAYQGQGYMAEAVQGLTDWAFSHPFCKVITASEVHNPASRRLLERLGAQLVSASQGSTSWEIQKEDN